MHAHGTICVSCGLYARIIFKRVSHNFSLTRKNNAKF
jgi:hypothetical protein